MVRIWFIALLFLVGCSSSPEKVKTEVVEVVKPVLYCPAPPIIQRPVLAIDAIDADSSPGEIAKRYKASIVQLKQYTSALERALRQYKRSSQSYEELAAEIEAANRKIRRLKQNSSS